MFANVVVDVKSSNVDIMYTYHIPQELEEFIGIGSRVMVNFGVRRILGYVIEIISDSTYPGEVKDILEVLDYASELTVEQIELAKFIKEDTNCLLVSALECMWPSFIKTKYRKFLFTSDPDKLDYDLAVLFGGKNKIAISQETIKNNPKIIREVKKGNLELSYDIFQYGKKKKEKQYHVNEAFDHLINSLSNIRYDVMNFVKRNDGCSSYEILEATGCSTYLINALVKEEYLLVTEDYVVRSEEEKEKKINRLFGFSLEQSQLVDKFTQLSGKPFLLYSNDETFKLDFYLSEAVKVVALNKKVEIVAPTILEAFKISKYFRRFLEGYKILSFTNDLPNSEYYDQYIKVIKGEYDILITTKIGAFLPVNDLGLLIVTNEGDFNYMNEYTPKYNMIKVLEKRAEFFKAKFVSTCNTPQVESYYQYVVGKKILLKYLIKDTSEISLVDLNKNYSKYSLLSEELIKAIKETIQNKKQAVLMMNSKGYSNYIVCRNCGEVLRCFKCRIPMTYYKEKEEIRCKYCGRKVENATCSCGSRQYSFLGGGLDKIGEELKDAIPSVRLLQMDSDNIKTTSDYHDALLQIENQDVDVIIGTRNVLSIFSNQIRLIGIIDVDQFLNNNDYRSNEQTYQLIDECRSHKECKTIIQGHHIDHDIISMAMNSDFDNFYEREIKERNSYFYPPFSEINRLIISGPYKDMYYCANYLKKLLTNLLGGDVDSLGPVYLTKYRGVQLVIKHNNYKKVINIISEVEKKFSNSKVTIAFERYPRNFG